MTAEELLREYKGGRRDFRGMDLRGIDLGGADFLDVDFRGAKLSGATLSDFFRPSSIVGAFAGADLRGARLIAGSFLGSSFAAANLEDAHFEEAFCWGVGFNGANLSNAHLEKAMFQSADLTGADLSSAGLTSTNFYSAIFNETKFSSAFFGNTVLANVDLTAAELTDTTHFRPSAIDHQTLERTATSLASKPYKRGEVEAFLRGCGVQQHLIEYFGTMIGRPIEFYSAFISYSHADRSFARALHDALQGRGIRCWLDEHDLRPGDRILDVVNDAIRSCDKLLLCCSESSLESWWVKDEIRKAIERERKERRDLIVPVLLDDYLLDGWNDGLAAEIRSRLAANVAGWESQHALFEQGVDRIVSALRTRRS
jgi:uncharacterized protein YjbI with pentapeptide repeats